MTPPAKTVACPHGMPSPESCVDCMNEGIHSPRPTVRNDVEVVSKPFKARFDGHCQSCNLGIHAGQPIVRMSDESHRHELCEKGRGLF